MIPPINCEIIKRSGRMFPDTSLCGMTVFLKDTLMSESSEKHKQDEKLFPHKVKVRFLCSPPTQEGVCVSARARAQQVAIASLKHGRHHGHNWPPAGS